ncbi:MAG: hypothetical protein RMX96_13645 [Nostoc sp. ChiSLP02]|nr:hypothetical protein [Nostoc sp. DedSLP05]MDZ8098941.1 hypothetical protein [Nostoc sp. DedSLP01]MDZ8185883.1 hypothetical protein [Nostoc sp. ChiSLP02]
MQPNSNYSALMKIVWQQDNSNRENLIYLATIGQWRANLNLKQIICQHQIIYPNCDFKQFDC